MGVLLTAKVPLVLLRAGWLEYQVHRRLQYMRSVPFPAAVNGAVAGIDQTCVTCIKAETPMAFCAGAFRPVVYVSMGLVHRLARGELSAVLLHELDHARRREPLRRLLAASLAEVAFYVPLLVWWARRRAELAELRADRAALEVVTPSALAGAMLAAGTTPSEGVAGFSQVTEARIAQLNAEPWRPAPAGWRLWTWSVIGAVTAVLAMTCLVQDLHLAFFHRL
jgi:Zn-dependent protease with chaperone function